MAARAADFTRSRDLLAVLVGQVSADDRLHASFTQLLLAAERLVEEKISPSESLLSSTLVFESQLALFGRELVQHGPLELAQPVANEMDMFGPRFGDAEVQTARSRLLTRLGIKDPDWILSTNLSRAPLEVAAYAYLNPPLDEVLVLRERLAAVLGSIENEYGQDTELRPAVLVDGASVLADLEQALDAHTGERWDPDLKVPIDLHPSTTLTIVLLLALRQLRDPRRVAVIDRLNQIARRGSGALEDYGVEPPATPVLPTEDPMEFQALLGPKVPVGTTLGLFLWVDLVVLSPGESTANLSPLPGNKVEPVLWHELVHAACHNGHAVIREPLEARVSEGLTVALTRRILPGVEERLRPLLGGYLTYSRQDAYLRDVAMLEELLQLARSRGVPEEKLLRRLVESTDMIQTLSDSFFARANKLERRDRCVDALERFLEGDDLAIRAALVALMV